MQKRRYGRTNLQVSIIGFGGTWISQLNLDEAKKVVQRAFERGINYFDTAKLDGDSEEKIGAALEDVRDQCIIATKTGSRTRRESLVDVQSSLHRLRTNRLDIIQLHGIDDEKTLKKATGAGGSLETCKQARAEGLVDFIGITSHKPRVLVKAIETGEFDTVLVPLNVVTRQALEELVPLAKEQDIGVAVMKPFSAKTSRIVTCLYKPSLSLLSDEPELKALLGNDNQAMVRSALEFVLAQDVATVIPGLSSVTEVDVAAKAGEDYKPLTSEKETRFRVHSGMGCCRDCGLCLPCPQGIDIAAVLRFHALYTVYGLPNWAKKLYASLEVKAERCTECGECEPKCPYALPIISMLGNAEKDLQR
ncbi:MAG: aldo/keto reductase [Candidatus Bathyarchaeota archaeon]|nr:aldo/keto reductase [Candidatus Bathyarchaeota archaeon]